MEAVRLVVALPVALATAADVFEPMLATQPAANLSFHWESPAEMRYNWVRYAGARSQCTWNTYSADTPLLDVEASQDEYNDHLLRYVPFPFCDPMCTLGRPRADSRLCTVPQASAAGIADDLDPQADELDSSAWWHIQRIGPVSSRGGNNFIVIRAADALDLSAVIAPPTGGLWIQAIFLAAVDAASGRVLSYPPIHIHHSHLGPHSMVGILDYVAPLHFPHGETSCREADGGDACYMFHFPPGAGFRLTEKFILNAMLNDVRAVNSPPLDVTLEAALLLTRARGMRNLGLWYVGADSDTNAFAMLLLHRQSFYTFTVPYRDESVLWSTFKPVRSGTLLNIWHHTHVTEGFDEMWLIGATPPELGLEEAGDGVFALSGCNAPFVPSVHGLTSDDVRVRILERMREARLGFRCVWRKPNAVWVDGVDGIEGVEPGLYARQTRVQCFEGSERIEAGVYQTFVTFFDTKALCEHCGAADGAGIPFYQGAGVQQHMHFQGYIAHDDGTSSLNYLFANRYDSYEWTTYPVREETLYCAFASKFAAPLTCPWELPGCAEPRYPSQHTMSVQALLFGAWGKLVQLSYFHFGPIFATGVLVHVLAIVCIWRACMRACCCRGRHAIKKSTAGPVARTLV